LAFFAKGGIPQLSISWGLDPRPVSECNHFAGARVLGAGAAFVSSKSKVCGGCPTLAAPSAASCHSDARAKRDRRNLLSPGNHHYPEGRWYCTRRAPEFAGRLAQAFDLAGITKTTGCPVLRVLGEGRESEMPAPSWFDRVSTTKSNRTRSNAADPCKKRKQGAPSSKPSPYLPVPGISTPPVFTQPCLTFSRS
jgi:hypothetical protein